MKYYCGLDVSLQTTAICVVNQNGDIIREGSAVTEPEAIDAWLGKLGLPMERIGLEAGATSPWLCIELLALGWPTICLETRHAKAALKAQQVKTDRNDARGLAHIVRTGWFKEVHVKSQESHKLRILLGNRRCLLDKRLDIDGMIRGTLKVFGLKIGKTTAGRYEARVCALIEDQPELQAYIFPMMQVRQTLIEQCNVLEKLILQHVRHDEVCRRFMTIPGVGPLTALAFKTFVDRPERFSKSRSVGAALGLTPRKYASGEIEFYGKITKCGDRFVRAHLFEAAKTLLGRTAGKDIRLKSWGLRIARRSSMKNACVAVARRLATVMLAMWRDGTSFEAAGPGTVRSAGVVAA